MKKGRRFLRQNIKIFGGQSDTFADAVKAVDKAYIMFAGHFADGTMDSLELETRGQDHIIEANSRYMTPKFLCDEGSIETLDEYVDPHGILQKLMEDDYVFGPDNKVEYMERIKSKGGIQ